MKFYLLFIFYFFCLIFVSAQTISPTSIPGLKLWIASDSAVIDINSKVSKLYDMSGNLNDAIQINTLSQPILIQTPNFPKPVVRFNGVSDYLSFNEIQDIRTCFFVVKHATGTSTQYPVILGHASLYEFEGNNGTLLFWNTYASPFLISGQAFINSVPTPPASIIKPINFAIISLITTGNTKAQYISSPRVPSEYWDGDIAELIIYNQALLPLEVKQVEQYLNNKYAPPIILPNDIIVSNNYCDTTIRPANSYNNQYTNFQWSTGVITPTISVNKTGKYWVNATNIFGKVSSDTITVNFPNYNKPLQNLICLNNSLLWNTQLPKSNYTFQWQDNSVDSLFTVTQAGNYYVKITDTFSCSITTDTVKITADNFAIAATLGPDLSICVGNSISLTNGISSAISYTWNDGSHNDSLLINTTGQYSVVVTNTNSCIVKDTINVTILGQAPIANYTYSAGCKNSAVSFSNISIPQLGNSIVSSNWNFGDILSASNTSTLTNPFHTFSDTGKYIVKLKVITNVGCEQTILKTIHIAPTPTVNFSNGISCQNDSTSFTSLISSPSYSISNWLWDFSDVASGTANTSSLANTKHLFSNQTNYTVKLVAINNAGCKDSISKIISVKAQVKSIFSYSAACTNEVVKFQDNSIVPSPNGTNIRNWNFGSSTATGTLVNHSYSLAGTYPVTLTVTGTNGCVSSSVRQVTVTLPPTSDFVMPLNFCINDSIKLFDASIGNTVTIQNWKWTVNTATYSNIQSPYLHVSDTGNHVIKLRVIDGVGCRDSITKNVYVYPLPVVDFSSTPSFIFSNTLASLTPNILNGFAYSWTGPNSFSSSLITPTYQFADTGSYQISLLVTNNHGCKNLKTKTYIAYNKRTDLAIIDILPIIQSDGYLDLTASLGNFGTTTITDFKINYKLTNGGQIKESWVGSLNSGVLYDYHFSGSALVNDVDKNSIVCVTISQINGGVDDNPQNDDQCLALFVKDTDIFSPYPNPTNNDIVFPVILKKETEIAFNVTNALGGSVLYNSTVIGGAGLNLIPLSISNLSSGCYIVKITINDKIFIKKIIKY